MLDCPAFSCSSSLLLVILVVGDLYTLCRMRNSEFCLPLLFACSFHRKLGVAKKKSAFHIFLKRANPNLRLETKENPLWEKVNITLVLFTKTCESFVCLHYQPRQFSDSFPNSSAKKHNTILYFTTASGVPLERNGDGGVRRGVVEEMISEEMQDAMETGVVGATLKQISKCEYVMCV